MFGSAFQFWYFSFAFQDDMNLTEDKKEPLRSRTKEQKRIMVEMQYKGAAQPKVDYF